MKLKRLVTCVAVLGFSSVPAFAADRAAESARAHALLVPFTEANGPGGAVGVVDLRTGEWIYRDAFGLADIAAGIPNKPETIYGIASVTKQFTAAAAAIAAQQGYLSLDDDIHKYLPEMPAYPKPITIRHLAQHVSGLKDDGWLVNLTGHPERYKTQEDYVKLITRQHGPNFPAGASYSYSNTNYLLLSEIIERTTKRTLAEYADEVIFRPLGMRNTYYAKQPRTKGVARPYERKKGAWAQSGGPSWAGRGTGGIMTTIDDFAKWARVLAGGEPKLPGGAALLRTLRTPAQLNDGTLSLYGFGLQLEPYRGLEMIRHGGSGGGFRAEIIIFPTLSLAAIGFWNNGIYPDATVQAMADIFIDSKDAPAQAVAKPITLTPAQTEGLVGTYREPTVGWPIVVSAQGGRLTMSYRSPPTPLLAFSATRFRSDADRGVEFERDANGRGLRLRQTTGWKFGSGLFERIEVVAPGPRELLAYTGDYYSADLEATYRLTVNDGRLTAVILGGNPAESGSSEDPFIFQPSIKDEFNSISDRLVMQFSRDAKGSVSGFSLAAQYGWVRDVPFVRQVH